MKNSKKSYCLRDSSKKKCQLQVDNLRKYREIDWTRRKQVGLVNLGAFDYSFEKSCISKVGNLKFSEISSDACVSLGRKLSFESLTD